MVSSLRRNTSDTVFLQETHLVMQEAEKLGRAFGGYVFCSEGSSNSRGVIILIKKQLQFRCVKQIKDKFGRVIMVWAEIQGQNLLLANIYAPNLDNQNFFIDLEVKLGTAVNYKIVLGGDFNLSMDPLLDHSCSKVYNTPNAKFILHICQSFGLIDIWRLLNPNGRDFTFFSNAHNIFSRIDFFLLSKSLIPSVITCKIGNIIISDHAWVCLELKPSIERKKSCRWCLNTSLLQNPVMLNKC